MKTNIFLLLSIFLLTITGLRAQISVNAKGSKWSRIEAGVALTPSANYVTTDADNGDGAGDGALRIKTIDENAQIQGAQYLLSGTAKADETIAIETICYQNAASYVKFKVELWDATANKVLKEITPQMPSPTTIGAVFPTISLSYTFQATDAGHQIAVRYVRTDGSGKAPDAVYNIAREVAIDNLKVNGVFVRIDKESLKK